MTIVQSPRFGPSGAASVPGLRSVGVEEELLLVDAQTLTPVPVAEAALGEAAAQQALGEAAAHQALGVATPSVPITLELEVKREQIEVVCPPLHSVSELAHAIREGRRMADEAAKAVGARAVPLATAPSHCQTHTVSAPRYDRMRERFAYTLDDQLTCGFHVHVGISSEDEGVAILDRVRPWLPLLLALSANSPYWHDVDTGFASYRYQAWGRWPTAGPTDLFGTPDAYHETVRNAVATGVSLDAGMIYFDARLSCHVPTVEIRICDVCLEPEDAAAIAVLIRALAERAVADWLSGEQPDGIGADVLRLASWRASRYGLQGDLLHPLTHGLVPAQDAVAAFLRHVDGFFADASECAFARRAVRAMLRRGSGAALQRRAVAESGDLTRSVAAAIDLGRGRHGGVPGVT
jgi:carboxylate-amine ligase